MVIAIIAILASLILPAVKGARDKALSIGCVGNLKQIGIAMTMYADSHEARLPPSHTSGIYSWRALIAPYVDKTTDVFNCPAASEHRYEGPEAGEMVSGETMLDGGYGINIVHWASGLPTPISAHPSYGGGAPLGNIKNPSNAILVADGTTHAERPFIRYDDNNPGFQYATACIDDGVIRHSGKANYLFADNHTSRLSATSIPCTANDCWWCVEGEH